MTTKHTPGPWKVSTDKKHVIAPMNSPVYFAIAEVLNWETDYETTQANAHLIAAAPELLELLETALEVMGSWDEEGDPEWAKAARAAIAKATP